VLLRVTKRIEEETDPEVIKELLRLSNELAMCLNRQIFGQSLHVFTAFQLFLFPNLDEQLFNPQENDS
jgi:hypothetical protein